MNRISVIIKKNGVNLLFVVFMGLMMSCGELEKGQYATDSIPPGQVSNVEVENVPGGAVLTYHLPDDDDLLYVKVLYTMSDGTQAEQKGSGYTSKLVIEGLGLSAKQTVQLICGDRSGNESAPVSAEIEPLDAPIYDILKSLQITEDFGGVRFTWDNPLKASIILTLYVLNEKGSFEELQNVYSSLPEAKYSIRGYHYGEEKTFGVVVKDRWNNKTEMISGAFMPLFEEQLERTKFRRWNPPGIPYMELNATWTLENLWDGLLVDPGYSTPAVALPVSITFNLGQRAKLNRIKVYQRQGEDANRVPLLFGWGNFRDFQVWGSPTPDVTEDFSKWILLGDFTSVKPSGLPSGQLTEEDVAYGTAGEEYIIEDNNDVPVQYVRVHVMSTHGGITNVQAWEMEFFGLIEDKDADIED